MLTDAASLGLALVAARLAARPPSGRFTFGLGRAEVLSAQVNGASLLVLAGVIAIEAVQRLFSPPDVEGGIVIVVGLLGAVVNMLVAWQLARAERRSLNVEGAMAHVLTDLYASLGAAAAGAVILLTGFREADPIASLLVAVLMLRSGWSLLRDAGTVLLEGSPTGTSPEEVGRALAAAPGIVEVHDLHVWEVTTGFSALAAHVLVAPGDDCHARRRELERLLDERFGIQHTTLQVDHEAERAAARHRGPRASPERAQPSVVMREASSRRTLVGLAVADLAGAGRVVAAAAVLEHQLADVGGAGAVEDRLARREHGVLLPQAPEDVHRDVALGEQRVDREAVGRVDDLLAAEVEHHQVALDRRAAQDLLLGQLGVLLVELDALGDVGQREDLLDGLGRARVDQHASSAGSWRSGSCGSGPGPCAGP